MEAPSKKTGTYFGGASCPRRARAGFRILSGRPKRKVAQAAFSFYFHSSLFTLHSSLFPNSSTRLFQRRDKKEERKEKVAFLLRLWRFGRKALIFSKKCDIMISKKGEDNE